MNRKYYSAANRRKFYAAHYEQQNGRCAICGKEADKLVIDHCHKTGLMRGLICHKDNVALGMFSDDTDLMRTAANYLDAHVRDYSSPQTAKVEESNEAIIELLADDHYPSTRARARELAKRTGMLETTAYSRLWRATQTYVKTVTSGNGP